MLALGLNMPALLRGAGSSTSIPSFSRDFATVKTLNHGIGPDITFTRTGTATYFDSAGVLTTATADVPRFDHDPSTLESRGLLIEEGRTNSIANSQCTGAVAGTAGTAPTGWSISGNANGLTRTIATGSINGFSYIDVTTSGTTTSSNISIVFDPQSSAAGYTASTGQTWTGSVYIALMSGSFPSSTTQTIGVTERDSSNTFLVSTTTSFSSATSSLQRFTATRTLNNASTAKVTFDIRVANVPISTAVDFTLRIAAPQLEQGAFATSYIPTTNAAVTRGADSAVVTPISSFYNQAEGTLFAEVQRDTLNTAYAVAASVDNDSFDNRIALALSGGSGRRFRFSIHDAAVLQWDESSVGDGTGWPLKIIASFAASNFNASAQGQSVKTQLSGSIPTVDRLHIGRRGAQTLLGQTNNPLNGHIRKVAYYPKRLSNERLRSLTT